MKRFYLIFLASLMLVNGSSAQDDSKFFNELLDFQSCTNCYFVQIDIQSGPYSGKALIENDDLIEVLRRIERIETPQYRTVVLDLLTDKRRLHINNAVVAHDLLLTSVDLPDTQFRLVRDYGPVNDIATRGCKAFVRHYFTHQNAEKVDPESASCLEFVAEATEQLALTKRTVGLLEENAIVSKLFEWRIPIRRDGVSGFLVIDKAVVKRIFRKAAPGH